MTNRPKLTPAARRHLESLADLGYEMAIPLTCERQLLDAGYVEKVINPTVRTYRVKVTQAGKDEVYRMRTARMGTGRR